MSTEETTPPTAERAAPLQHLNYPAPHLSTLDRPVEPIVRAARTVRIAVRVAFIVMALVGAAFAAWAIHQLHEAFSAMGR